MNYFSRRVHYISVKIYLNYNKIDIFNYKFHIETLRQIFVCSFVEQQYLII